jgi:acetyl-CoA carboxylase beta subunit
MPVTVEIERRNGGDHSGQPAWQCPRCHEGADPQAVKANLQVCPHCGHHLRVGARERIAQLADPCTGGVVASFATLADICIAEPGALLAFSGPRVIAETTRETLPPDFGSAERNLALGHLDAVVPRAELRERVAGYLRLLEGGGDDERRTAGRARGRGARRLATAATRRVATLVSHARRPFDRGDREVAGAPEES